MIRKAGRLVVPDNINLRSDLLSKKVCYLTGEDVVDFLDRQGLLEQLTAEQIAQFIEYADKKLDPSWEEELESLLDLPGAKIILGAPQTRKEGRETDQTTAEVVKNACRCDCTGEVRCIRQPDNTWVAKCEGCGETGPPKANWWTAAHHYPHEAEQMKNRKTVREMQEGWALAEPGVLGKPAIRDKIKAAKMANNPGQSLGRKNGKERGEIE